MVNDLGYIRVACFFTSERTVFFMLCVKVVNGEVRGFGKLESVRRNGVVFRI